MKIGDVGDGEAVEFGGEFGDFDFALVDFQVVSGFPAMKEGRKAFGRLRNSRGDGFTEEVARGEVGQEAFAGKEQEAPEADEPDGGEGAEEEFGAPVLRIPGEGLLDGVGSPFEEEDGRRENDQEEQGEEFDRELEHVFAHQEEPAVHELNPEVAKRGGDEEECEDSQHYWLIAQGRLSVGCRGDKERQRRGGASSESASRSLGSCDASRFGFD